MFLPVTCSEGGSHAVHRCPVQPRSMEVVALLNLGLRTWHEVEPGVRRQSTEERSA